MPDAPSDAPSGRLQTMSMAVHPPADGDVVTIGVVVDIPEPLRTFLRTSRASFGDPLAEAIPPHITVLPPTDLTPGIGPDVYDHLAAACAVTEPFTVRLEGTGTFRPVSPVAFVRLVEGADACDDLQRIVRTGPLSRPLSFPYHPHVTVAHHLDDAALDHAERTLADYRAEFRCEGLGLYEHGRDGVWRLRRRFYFSGS